MEMHHSRNPLQADDFDLEDESPPENPDNYLDDGEDYFSDREKEILSNGTKLEIMHLLSGKSKKFTAKYLKDELLQSQPQERDLYPDLVFTEALNMLLNPNMPLNSPSMIKWLKWLMAGGDTPRDFYKKVEQFDNPTTCSLVWIADFMAYRCRSCGISPCMSLCLNCFNNGDHENHDYHMFKSQGGGACDCGNRAVMKESGFCSRHNGSTPVPIAEPPADLLVMAKALMPRLLLRFILHCRSQENPAESESWATDVVQEFEPFVVFLQELCSRGVAMRNVMTEAFCCPEIYERYTEVRPGMKFYDKLLRCKENYLEALESIPFGEVPEGYEDISTLHGPLVHKTFMEEVLFWTLKLEFPQKLVCLLLNMRSDTKYEDAFARAFVQHYSRISVMLTKARDSDPLSHRVVHVSVQLFSDQKLAYRMNDSYHLLYVMVLSVKKMIKNISVPSTLHDMSENKHKVVNCMHNIMKKHSYWPLVSDLNNILSHKPIAEKFMSDPRLLKEWFSFLSMFQGMNNNLREMTQHIEYEPQSYYAAFSAELEISSCPLWALISHLKDEATQKFSLTVMHYCLNELQNWFKEIGFYRPDRFHHNEATFHLPLHRNFSLLLCQAVKKQGVKLSDALPNTDMLTLLLVHPLRAQIAFHEILCDLWVRNGLQIKGQAMTYIQCHFCNSMFDPDLYLLQVGASELPKDSFLLSIVERFHALKYLNFSKNQATTEPESEGNNFKLLESCLVFLTILTTNRHNIGLNEQEIAEIELIALACTLDKTHSKLMEFVPERCASNPNIDLDAIVKKYTRYIGPDCQKSGEMREGLYVPLDSVWEDLYDPIIMVTRCLHKKDYQSSLNRFQHYCRRSGKVSSNKASKLWPPYRLPSPVDDAYNDPRRILACRTFHGILFTLLYKAFHESNYPESMLGLVIFLLELTIDYQATTQEDGKELAATDFSKFNFSSKASCPDGLFHLWYSTDNIFKNAAVVIDRILLKNSLTALSAEGESTDIEMEEIESPDLLLCLPPSNAASTRPVASGSELVPYDEASERSSDDPLRMEVARPFTPSDLRGSGAYHMRRSAPLPAVTGGDYSDPSQLPLSYTADPSKALMRAGHQDEPSRTVTHSHLTDGFQEDSSEYLSINESLISLLIKLHSKLSDRPGTFRPQFSPPAVDSRIGDGAFFIGKVLNKLGEHDEEARKCILNTMCRLCPSDTDEETYTSSDEETTSKVREEKRKRAKERQKKVMAVFSQRQQKFWARNMPDLGHKDAGEYSMKVDEQDRMNCFKEYDCVICNQSIPATQKRPFGLIAYLQPTSVHGSRTTMAKPFAIPLSEKSKARIRSHRYTLAKYMKERSQTFNQYFELYSWLSSMDMGWEGGVHVQTCGHHLHLDCHKSYVLSLHSQAVSPENVADYPEGEYFCPFCRQLANSLLPISNDIELHQGVPNRSGSLEDFVADIDDALKNVQPPNFNRVLATALSDVIENLTKATPAKYRNIAPANVSPPSMFFISSVFRTNLEIELVQRGGSLVNQSNNSRTVVKRSSLIPLMHILANCAKMLNRGNDRSSPGGLRGSNWIRQVWSSLSQRHVSDFEGAVTPNDSQVPMLFRDPVTILIHMVLLLPSKIDNKYYRCLVLNVYRLVVAKAAVSALRSLPEERRPLVTMSGPLAPLLAMAYNNLRDSPFFRSDQPPPSFKEETWASAEFTCELREMCLSFLRIAALLKAHMMDERLPTIADPLAECGTLERYLDLWNTCSVVNTAVMGRMCGLLISNNGFSNMSSTTSSSGVPVETQVGELSGAMKIWCSQVAAFASRAPVAASSLLTNVRFFRPRLLSLPHTFDEVFQYYHQKKCSVCNSVPRDPGVCLVCGTIVCMRHTCCSQNRMFEGVLHALDCGAGTAMYLAILQAAVIVVRHPRACLWGSIHLDCYGEEDKDLKRGKPLYLSKLRYQLLEKQWLNLSFTHSPQKWVWHNNDL